jgi:hypothetical protein
VSHPYSAGVKAYQKAERDFDYFATNALVTIPEAVKRISRATSLVQANSFYVNRTSLACCWLC